MGRKERRKARPIAVKKKGGLEPIHWMFLIMLACGLAAAFIQKFFFN